MCKRHSIGGRVVADQKPAWFVGVVWRSAVHHPCVHQTNIARLSSDWYGTLFKFSVQTGINLSSKFTILKMAVAFSVRTRNQQWDIRFPQSFHPASAEP